MASSWLLSGTSKGLAGGLAGNLLKSRTVEENRRKSHSRRKLDRFLERLVYSSWVWKKTCWLCCLLSTGGAPSGWFLCLYSSFTLYLMWLPNLQSSLKSYEVLAIYRISLLRWNFPSTTKISPTTNILFAGLFKVSLGKGYAPPFFRSLSSSLLAF